MLMMNNRYNFDDLLNKSDERVDDCLTEKDFYPPADDRHIKSNIQDIYGGDTFADYCGYIFNILEEEDYYE